MKFSIFALFGLALVTTKKIYISQKSSTKSNNNDNDDYLDNDNDEYYTSSNSYYYPHSSSNTGNTHKHRTHHTVNEEDNSDDGIANVRVYRLEDYLADHQGSSSSGNSNSHRYTTGSNSRSTKKRYTTSSNSHSYRNSGSNYSNNRFSTRRRSSGYGRLNGSNNQWMIQTNGHTYPITAIEYRRGSGRRSGRGKGFSRNYRLQLGNFGHHQINHEFTFGSRTSTSNGLRRGSRRFSSNNNQDFEFVPSRKYSSSVLQDVEDLGQTVQVQNKKVTKKAKTANKGKAKKTKKVTTVTATKEEGAVAQAPAEKKVTKVTTTKTTTTDETGKTTTKQQKKVDGGEVKKAA